MIPYSMKLKQDSDGRIVEKVETVGGRKMTWEYAYDKDGRLVEARLDRRVVCQCGYDGQGRRAWDRFPLRKTRKESKYGYTSDNRLHSAGKSSYVHDRSGFRKIWNSAGRYTLYEYSRDHRLLKVEVENEGRVFEFAHDENGQRKAKYLNGELVEAYNWFDVVRMDAFFDGHDAFEFVYEKKARLPYAMRKSDGTVLLLYYDQVGSLRVVADASGNVIKEILYDPFGGIIEDSRPELGIPLGFAGGLHDRDMGFVRIGWRDYDTATGRWTAPDPLGDKGGDPDWYGYCLDDPVNAVDPLGLFNWDSPGGRIIKSGMERAWKGACAGGLAGSIGGMGIGAAPGAVAGGMIGFPVGMLEGTIAEAWKNYNDAATEPVFEIEEYLRDMKEETDIKTDWGKYKKR